MLERTTASHLPSSSAVIVAEISDAIKGGERSSFLEARVGTPLLTTADVSGRSPPWQTFLSPTQKWLSRSICQEPTGLAPPRANLPVTFPAL